MSPPRLDPLSEKTRELLAEERALPPVPAEFRHRALMRARGALRDGTGHSSNLLGIWERWRTAILVAPALAFTALAFAGFGRSEAPVRPSSDAPHAPPPAARGVAGLSPAPVLPAPSAVPESPSPSLPAGTAETTETRAPAARNTEVLELRVLQRARSALAKGEYAAALGAVAEHQRQFPKGRLWEESEALRIRALIGLGKSEQARQAVERFRARFPRSVLLRRIESSVSQSP